MRFVRKVLTIAIVAVLCVGGTFAVTAAELDVVWYAQQNPDVVAVMGNSPQALRNHYNTYGEKEGRMANNHDVNIAWYAQQNPDVVAAVGNSPKALRDHYNTYGRKEGRMANDHDVEATLRQLFDSKEYAALYPDVAAAFGDDAEAMFQHYLSYGILERRRPAQNVSKEAAAGLRDKIVEAMNNAGLDATPGSSQIVAVIEGTLSSGAGSEAVQQTIAQVQTAVGKAIEDTAYVAKHPEAAVSSSSGSSSSGSGSNGSNSDSGSSGTESSSGSGSNGSNSDSGSSGTESGSGSGSNGSSSDSGSSGTENGSGSGDSGSTTGTELRPEKITLVLLSSSANQPVNGKLEAGKSYTFGYEMENYEEYMANGKLHYEWGIQVGSGSTILGYGYERPSCQITVPEDYADDVFTVYLHMRDDKNNYTWEDPEVSFGVIRNEVALSIGGAAPAGIELEPGKRYNFKLTNPEVLEEIEAANSDKELIMWFGYKYLDADGGCKETQFTGTTSLTLPGDIASVTMKILLQYGYRYDAAEDGSYLFENLCEWEWEFSVAGGTVTGDLDDPGSDPEIPGATIVTIKMDEASAAKMSEGNLVAGESYTFQVVGLDKLEDVTLLGAGWSIHNHLRDLDSGRPMTISNPMNSSYISKESNYASSCTITVPSNAAVIKLNFSAFYEEGGALCDVATEAALQGEWDLIYSVVQ